METPKTGFAVTAFSALLRPFLACLAKPASPKYHGTTVVPGLERSVRVHWDDCGVPDVYAASEHDLFMAQGYLHAQERLWQMDMSRRFLSGRMAEALGAFPVPWREVSSLFRRKRSTDFDFFMRLIGIRHGAIASLASIPDRDRARLKAYSDGINRYIESRRRSLPWEFRVLRYRPDPWTPEDSLTIGKGFALLLSTALFSRLNMIAIAGRLAREQDLFRMLRPRMSAQGPFITKAVWDGIEGVWKFLNGAADHLLSPAGCGSNNWVVAPHRSSSGKAMLCNDPHLRMTLPSIWYVMALRAEPDETQPEPYEVWGASIPGTPCVQVGHNRRIAWGMTAALCDDVELYREKVHRLDPDRYLAGDSWQRMERREETIRVRGQKPTLRTVRCTRHGPVLSDFQGNDASGEVLSLRWTAHEPSHEFGALYGLNRARNWEEFLQSLSGHGAPTLNYLYADVDGNIGYTLAGKIPLRTREPNLLPLDGWRAENLWQGYIPFEELPRIYNPPEGIIATANNRVVDPSYPRYLSHFFEPPYRITRIQECLRSKRRFSMADMAGLQRDSVSLHARSLIAGLRSDLEALADLPASRLARILLAWDGDCSADSVAATIFHVFHQRLMFNLLTPVLGEDLMMSYLEVFNQCLVPVDDILKDPASAFFKRASRATIVSRSLREVDEELAAALGPDLSGWQWGVVHTLTLDHALSRVRLLKPLLSIGPAPSAGDGTTVQMGFYRHSNPYQHTVGASLRLLIELDESPRSQYVLPSGQSGHYLSPHYRDQFELWSQGRYVPFARSDENIPARNVLELVPHTS